MIHHQLIYFLALIFGHNMYTLIWYAAYIHTYMYIISCNAARHLYAVHHLPDATNILQSIITNKSGYGIVDPGADTQNIAWPWDIPGEHEHHFLQVFNVYIPFYTSASDTIRWLGNSKSLLGADPHLIGNIFPEDGDPKFAPLIAPSIHHGQYMMDIFPGWWFQPLRKMLVNWDH